MRLEPVLHVLPHGRSEILPRPFVHHQLQIAGSGSVVAFQSVVELEDTALLGVHFILSELDEERPRGELVGVLRGAVLPLAPQRLPALRARERGHVPGYVAAVRPADGRGGDPDSAVEDHNDKTLLQTVPSIGGLFSQIKA